VEFAVVVPIFFTLIFGLTDIGRGFMVKTLLDNAARSGCRAGVLQGATYDNVTAAVTTALSGQGINNTTTVVAVNGTTVTAFSSTSPQSADQVSVTVSVPVGSITWLPGTHYLTGTITSAFTLLHE
jgi:Flp pilus assembly protein TadG